MFRNDFLNLLLSTGMVLLKEVRPLTVDKKQDTISELELLSVKTFNDIDFARKVSEKFSIKYLDLKEIQIPKEVLELCPRSTVIKYRCFPVKKSNEGVLLATFDPTIVNSAKDLRTVFKTPVDIVITGLSAWNQVFSGITQSVEEILSKIEEVRPEANNKDVEVKVEEIGEEIITLVNRVLAEAFIKKASDIHIEPYEKVFRVRMRMDGNLVTIVKPPMNFMLPLISRVKIMANMDIAERRKPQDGRIKLKIDGAAIDYRVSSCPTLFGEKIVLRLLDSSNLQLDMTKLGMEEKQLLAFKEGIHRPFGMVLVTGPTGSGKTTTLYSALAELNTVDTNIATAEDPVEFNLEGINQVNVRKDIGLTFASVLKSFLRQDPDIIMLGEIRDLEAGEIGVEAALTGHLVLSTLHTNDAASTVVRLLNMGIEPFLITGALNCIVAQRLCRRICNGCKVEYKEKKEFLMHAGLSAESSEKIRTFKGEGCKICNGTGFKGRVAIYEVLTSTLRIKELILEHASADVIKRAAIKEGMKTLRMAALTKVAQGMTSLEEAVSNSGSDK